MYKEIRIWDLDGTVIDSSHRQLSGPDGRLDLLHWIENSTPEKIRGDTLLPHAECYKEGVQDPEILTVVATAREMSITDIAYVHDFLGKPDFYVYRGRGDRRPDHELKVEGLEKILGRFPTTSVVRFWDDNIKNVEEVERLAESMGFPVEVYHV